MINKDIRSRIFNSSSQIPAIILQDNEEKNILFSRTGYSIVQDSLYSDSTPIILRHAQLSDRCSKYSPTNI